MHKDQCHSARFLKEKRRRMQPVFGAIYSKTGAPQMTTCRRAPATPRLCRASRLEIHRRSIRPYFNLIVPSKSRLRSHTSRRSSRALSPTPLAVTQQTVLSPSTWDTSDAVSPRRLRSRFRRCISCPSGCTCRRPSFASSPRLSSRWLSLRRPVPSCPLCYHGHRLLGSQRHYHPSVAGAASTPA